MRITYDQEADAMYIYLAQHAVERTVPVSDYISVDLGPDGEPVGVELLFVSRMLADADFSHLRLQLPQVGKLDLRLPTASE